MDRPEPGETEPSETDDPIGVEPGAEASDDVEEADRESFPASDPPSSWSGPPDRS